MPIRRRYLPFFVLAAVQLMLALVVPCGRPRRATVRPGTAARFQARARRVRSRGAACVLR